MILELRRDFSDGSCTLGRMTTGERAWDTMERPWVPHATAPCGVKGVSCIPAGTYQLVPHSTEQHRNVWALVNPQLWVYHLESDVPAQRLGVARTLVLIHVANWAAELRGCIAPGKRRAKVDGVWMVQSSGDAINELRNVLNGKFDNKLIVSEVRK